MIDPESDGTDSGPRLHIRPGREQHLPDPHRAQGLGVTFSLDKGHAGALQTNVLSTRPHSRLRAHPRHPPVRMESLRMAGKGWLPDVSRMSSWYMSPRML